jgi:hypothetical protein
MLGGSPRWHAKTKQKQNNKLLAGWRLACAAWFAAWRARARQNKTKTKQ